jgi:hypothetical protein
MRVGALGGATAPLSIHSSNRMRENSSLGGTPRGNPCVCGTAQSRGSTSDKNHVL